MYSWLLVLQLGFGIPVGGHFYNEASFWGMHFCRVFEFMVGPWSYSWALVYLLADIFIMSLLSGAGISVRCSNSWLGIGLAVGRFNI